MTKMSAVIAAAAVAAFLTLPGSAQSAERKTDGLRNSDQIEVSSVRRHHRRVWRTRYVYRTGGYYRPYYRAHYARPYYRTGYYRPYYRPAYWGGPYYASYAYPYGYYRPGPFFSAGPFGFSIGLGW